LSIVSAYDQATADAKWALTLTDIDNWEEIETIDDVKSVSNISFFEGVSAQNRLDFRNKLLRRYGQPELTTEQPTGIIEGTLAWF
jgi:hypothetical protein